MSAVFSSTCTKDVKEHSHSHIALLRHSNKDKHPLNKQGSLHHPYRTVVDEVAVARKRPVEEVRHRSNLPAEGSLVEGSSHLPVEGSHPVDMLVEAVAGTMYVMSSRERGVRRQI